MPHKYSMGADKLRAQFIAEFRRINPASAREYNAKRRNGVPGWATAARLLGVKKWSELLMLCGLSVKERGQTVTQVRSIVDLEQQLKKLNKKNS